MRGDRTLRQKVLEARMPDLLIASALAARLHAFAPFSKFLVGAAIEDADGRMHTGCNVENATYGLTLCAERVALFKAISEGVRKFRRVAVAADTEKRSEEHTSELQSLRHLVCR